MFRKTVFAFALAAVSGMSTAYAQEATPSPSPTASDHMSGHSMKDDHMQGHSMKNDHKSGDSMKSDHMSDHSMKSDHMSADATASPSPRP